MTSRFFLLPAAHCGAALSALSSVFRCALQVSA